MDGVLETYVRSRLKCISSASLSHLYVAAGQFRLTSQSVWLKVPPCRSKSKSHLYVAAGHLALEALFQGEQGRVDGVFYAHLRVVSQRTYGDQKRRMGSVPAFQK